jgi:hypothetical protein
LNFSATFSTSSRSSENECAVSIHRRVEIEKGPAQCRAFSAFCCNVQFNRWTATKSPNAQRGCKLMAHSVVSQRCRNWSLSEAWRTSSRPHHLSSICVSAPQSMSIEGEGLICPTGVVRNYVSSPVSKNILLRGLVKTAIQLASPVPIRGAFRDRHGRGAGCGAALGCRRLFMGEDRN